MKRLAFCLAVVAGAIFADLNAMAEERPAMTLPLDRFLAIPDGVGMGFFYGKWDSTGLMGGGPITIKKDLIGFYESDMELKEFSYRIIDEGKNYVLTTERLQFEIGGSIRTAFVVFTLQPLTQGDRDLDSAELLVHECSDFSMEGSDHAFHWSKERLLKVFAETCGKAVVRDTTDVFGNGWNIYRYSGFNRTRR